MPRTWPRAATYVALAATDTLLAGRGARRLRILTKPLLMPSLARAFVASAGQAPATPRRATLAAHALSGAGDIALLGHGRRAFLTGLGSFFAAHGAYLVGLGALHERQSAPLDRRGSRVALAMWAVAGPMMTVAAHRKHPALAVPVAAYVTILSAVLGAATTLDPALPAEVRRRIGAGAALFLLSDTLLGAREFLLADQSDGLDALVMAGYTAGQGLIAAGVAALPAP